MYDLCGMAARDDEHVEPLKPSLFESVAIDLCEGETKAGKPPSLLGEVYCVLFVDALACEQGDPNGRDWCQQVLIQPVHPAESPLLTLQGSA
jgi:hypothetical protein